MNSRPLADAVERAAALAALRGVFADGYTDDLVRQAASAAVGVPLVVVWAFEDRWGLGGDSELLVADGDQWWELPDGLWEYLGDPKCALAPEALLDQPRGARRELAHAPIRRDPWTYCPTAEAD
jgi:hypothetical protein